MCRQVWISAGVAVAATMLMGPSGTEERDGAPLRPYSNAWVMTFHGDDGTVSPPPLWEDRMDTVTWHGRTAMRRVQIEHRLVPAGGFQRWENVFDPTTLAPYMTEQRQRNGTFVRWEHDGFRVRRIRSAYAAPGAVPAVIALDSTITEYTMAAPFVDFFDGMYATVFATKTLSVGLKGTIPALITPDTIVRLPFAVLASDTVRGVGGRSAAAFRVEVEIESGAGSSGGVITAWVIDKPPYVLRLTTRQRSPAGYWSWDETP